MNGLVFYKGASQLDSKPIVGIVVGFNKSSTNTKTGDLLQSYILVDNGKTPQENASYSSADGSVCGNCPHKASPEQKTGSCYVNLCQGPSAVFRAYTNGKYDILNDTHKDWFSGRNLRMGSYGDPAAIPFETWIKIRNWCVAHTAYTHQWRTCDVRFKTLCMASCDTEADYIEAKKQGWRTFRVKLATDKVFKTEIGCPASKEMGNKTQCAGCMACNGSKKPNDLRRDITINAHGMQFKIDRFTTALNKLKPLTMVK